jgi:hypothetical protein
LKFERCHWNKFYRPNLLESVHFLKENSLEEGNGCGEKIEFIVALDYVLAASELGIVA